MSDASDVLAREWASDVQILRECLGLQRQAADQGVTYPILDLLVARGHLRRELALRSLPPGYRFPDDSRTRNPEAAVLTRGRTNGLLSESAWAAAQTTASALSQLQVPATLSFVLVQLGHLKAKDLEQLDGEIQGPQDRRPPP